MTKMTNPTRISPNKRLNKQYDASARALIFNRAPQQHEMTKFWVTKEPQRPKIIYFLSVFIYPSVSA